jgi:tRNA uridine 5-carboxymethylaminomethyl modification enzyme
MVDDLVTRGIGGEPYRIFTSRAEHRLLLREGNADERLSAIAHAARLVGDDEFERVRARLRTIKDEIARLEAEGLASELRRPEVTLRTLKDREAEPPRPSLPADVESEVECRIKYAGYIARQEREIVRLKSLENLALPSGLDYAALSSLSSEVREKLRAVMPRTLGQAARIPGVTPAAVAVLAVHLKRRASGESSDASAH